MIPFRQLLKGLENIEKREGTKTTLLGVGPMSRNVLQGSLELAREKDFPLILIASRNQVDKKDFGGGYVLGWDQKEFVGTVKAIAKEIGFKGLLYICRDHGGPWQRDNEKGLPEQEAMKLAKKSYLADLLAGFHLLHLDPTKVPHAQASSSELTIRRTIELIDYIEKEKNDRGLTTPLDYEVGTEDITGGLTDVKAFEEFLINITKELTKRRLPQPLFIVGQTGTLVKMRENVGQFNPDKARELTSIARKYGIGFKEHNADYLKDKTLSFHPDLGITAANVAPEFGIAETQSYLKLAELEKERIKKGGANFTSIIQEAVLKSNRWKKWLKKEQSHLSEQDIAEDKDKLMEITRVCGHYVFVQKEVEKAKGELFYNLKTKGVIADPEEKVKEDIKAVITKYVEAFHLAGITSKILIEGEGKTSNNPQV